MQYILGDGISGLIWKFYNPEFEIIAPRQFKPNTSIKVPEPFIRSQMIWLHDCVETRQLLIDLGWKEPEKYIRKSKIGYYDNGVIRDKLTPQLKQTLVAKKMTPWSKEPRDIQFKEDSARLSLTGTVDGTNFMNVIGIDHGEIMYKLHSQCETTHGYVGEIKDDVIGITNLPPNTDSGYVYEKYNQLVSTIPAPVFWRAWNAGHSVTDTPQFESLPITFVTTKIRPEEFDGDYEMIYYDESVPFCRASRHNHTYCLEFTGNISREVFESMYPEIRVRDWWQLPSGRIKSQQNLPPENVIFSGRFSQWDHSVTTEHVIRQALDYRDTKKEEKWIDT